MIDIKNFEKIIYQKTRLPLLEIEIILANILKKTREFLLAHPDFKITKKQTAQCQKMIRRRENGEPLAYLTGYKEFFGLNFIVNNQVLIPRPETELLLEEAMAIVDGKQQKTNGNQGTNSPKKELIKFIDIGTGSGCIIITLAKLLGRERKSNCQYQFFATDISKSALRVARRNAQLHKVKNKIKFFRGNLIKPLAKYLQILPAAAGKGRRFKKPLSKKSPNAIACFSLIILANLPYLTPVQIKRSPTIKYEPKIALSAGPDGLKYYRQLIKQLKNLRAKFYALCEIDPSQSNKIKSLINQQLPGARLKIKKDLRGHNRLVIIET